ncbi:MAG: sugar ABC transporter permease [Clostridiales bacterium]|nr:sugar ABC transporter permease [Clostridiales bacterium]
MDDRRARGGLPGEVWALLKGNIRNYAMYLALLALFILFTLLTDGAFITARNLTNLINQTGYVAVMACGMTLVLIIQQIDLSIGFVAGFLGACAATLLARGVAVPFVLPLILLAGILIGSLEGLIIGRVGVPAFVTTLACQFIFRGMLSLVTESTGTILVQSDAFNQISNGFLPAVFRLGPMHGLSLVVGAVSIALIVLSRLRARKDLRKYRFRTTSAPVFWATLLLFSAVIGVLSYVLANYRGVSWTIVVVAVVAFVYDFMMRRTRLGRHIYGMGGNREAALLSGVDTQRILLFVFASMGMLAGLGGVLFTSRLQSATPTAGSGFELDAIASCYIGGVSTSGGIGKVTNSIIGAFVIMSLTNGLNLMGVGITYQYVIKGIIFILAVAFDVRSRAKKAI